MPKNTQPVSIGRIVHYQAHGSPNGQHRSVARAAVITALRWPETAPEGTNLIADQDIVDVCVLNPTGLYFNQSCPYDADGAPGTWRWPPRV